MAEMQKMQEQFSATSMDDRQGRRKCGKRTEQFSAGGQCNGLSGTIHCLAALVTLCHNLLAAENASIHFYTSSLE
ncbi:MAG: hypothetical protein A3H91_01795 [Gammaproteobacteria bacterium RIFCSPLOWO2_02_FULL_61_13]|nr:MAG: hypothetical protein A3H91_01795 [Gammaproteobacteria bacterium RIFCSPLOWO2_02_FULL_61_13]